VSIISCVGTVLQLNLRGEKWGTEPIRAVHWQEVQQFSHSGHLSWILHQGMWWYPASSPANTGVTPLFRAIFPFAQFSSAVPLKHFPFLRRNFFSLQTYRFLLFSRIFLFLFVWTPFFHLLFSLSPCGRPSTSRLLGYGSIATSQSVGQTSCRNQAPRRLSSWKKRK